MPTEMRTSRELMDELVDSHYRSEERGDLDAIVSGFLPGAEHDVAGRPGGAIYGGAEIAGFYRALFSDLQIDAFEPVRRLYGDAHVVDESVLHGKAIGRPFGIPGRGQQVRVRLLHVFEFSDGLIARESAWLDLIELQRQLDPRTPEEDR
jgi:hypothetical protein